MEPIESESLIKLLDDPDEEIFVAVRKKIRQLGPELLPSLETAVQETLSPLLFERIENIIKVLQLDRLKTEFTEWMSQPVPRLLDGAWLIARTQYHDLSKEEFEKPIMALRSEIWLEFSGMITSLEKIRIMNSLIFKNDRVGFNRKHSESPGNNFLNRVMVTGLGNDHSINLLYAIIAQELRLPIYMVNRPGTPVLAYVDIPSMAGLPADPDPFHVLFYINPVDNGTLHSRDDLTHYLVTCMQPVERSSYAPVTNPECIRLCLERLAEDYADNDSIVRKEQVEDLMKLWK